MDTTTSLATADPALRRALAEESFAIDVVEQICAWMEREGISRAELARRLGTSKANITQLLRGRNLGVKTVAAVIHVMGGVPMLHIGCAAAAPAPAPARLVVIEGGVEWSARAAGARYTQPTRSVVHAAQAVGQ
jgi:hypothetical protein